MSSTKAALRLAEAIDDSGRLTRRGADKLVDTVSEFAKIAASSGCAELMAFATSAVRDAKNSDEVLSRVRSQTGVDLQALTGVDESRLTFLAVRRWYGWSAGRIINLHPSLLPAFPGLDGIGQAWNAGVPEAGCTVHWVNAEIDGGAHLGQTRVTREAADTLESFAHKIHAAEHALLPAVIARLSETLS